MTNKLSLELLKPLIEKLSIENHLRSPEEVFEFLLSSGYQLLPYPIRIIVSETVYQQFCNDRKDDITKFVWIKCNNCGAEK